MPATESQTWNRHSAPEFVQQLLHRAEQAGASDVHLQRRGSTAEIAFRLDGVLSPASPLLEPVTDRVFGRIKYLARLKTYQESLPQEGRIDKADAGTANDVRVTTYPTVTGEKIVLRLFNSPAVRQLRDLCFPEETVVELQRFLGRTTGLLLLTGPAGSGKTSTIYACLQYLVQSGGRHIITVEDPVEQILPGIMQTEVNEARGLTFAAAARYLLRQDPQVLVLGEIRDDETAQLAVRAALTGHLVISTLHAGSCKGVVDRLIVMCPDHYAVLSSLELILNQRLLRRLCVACHGAGCDVCLQTGFQGRVPVVERVQLDEARRREIRDNGPEVIRPKLSLEAGARRLVEMGMTNEIEFHRGFGP